MTDVIAYFNYLESGVCLRINRLSHRVWIRRFFSLISRLGDGSIWTIAGMLMLALQGAWAAPAILQMFLTAVFGVLLYKWMKNRFVRERPYINHGDILCGTAPLDQYSFPSGHTLHAASFTVMFGHFEPLLLPIIVPFALLVALSRVVLGLHYPSDVIVGAAIGAALAGASITLF